MSLILTLIPVSFGNEYLISIEDENNENNIIGLNMEKEIEFDVYISETIKKRKKENFGSKTVIPTNIREKNILIKSLSNYIQRLIDQEQLQDFEDTGSITVEESENGTYNLCFQGYFRQYDIDEIKKEILPEYAEDLQEITYNKIIEKIKENNLNIESEDITNDDSILLTVNI